MDCEPHAFTSSLKILILVFICYMCLGVCMCVACILSGTHVDIIRLLVGAISLLPLHRAVGHKLRKLGNKCLSLPLEQSHQHSQLLSIVNFN